MSEKVTKTRMFLVKYALARGITEIEGEWREPATPEGHRYFAASLPGQFTVRLFREREVCATREEARAAFSEMQRKKIKSLYRQIHKQERKIPEFWELP